MAGVAAGALPMIHTHSFLALGMICAVWLLLDLTDNSLFVTGKAAYGRKAASASKGSSRRNGKVTASGRRNGKVTSSSRRSVNVSAVKPEIRLGSSSADATVSESLDSICSFILDCCSLA